MTSASRGGKKSGRKVDGSFMKLHSKLDVKHKARVLRSNMTEAESALWTRLRRKQTLGLNVYRQKPIGYYIVDFYIPGANLVIEVDGSHQAEEAHFENDIVRDAYLGSVGLKVLRFTNRQVMTEVDEVIKTIEGEAAKRQTPRPRILQSDTME